MSNVKSFAPSRRELEPPAPAASNPRAAIVRAAIATARARIDKTRTSLEHAIKAWPDDLATQLLLRAASPPMDLVGNTATALQHVALEIMPMLVPHSAAAELFEDSLSVTLSREAGAFTIPGLTVVPMKFVGHGVPKPVVQGLSTSARVDPHKIAGITVVSSELFAMEFVEQVMERLLLESAGPSLDSYVFSANAGTADYPPGLLNGVAPLTAAAATTATRDAMIEDLITLAKALAPVAGKSKIAVITNLAQGVSLELNLFTPLGEGQERMIETMTSNSVPAGTIIAVACNAVVGALGVPEFEASTGASLHMEGVTPLPIVGAGGTVAAPVQSMFQIASVAIKMILPASWALRAQNAVAWMSGVNW